MVIDNYFSLGLLMGAVLSFLLSMYLLFYPSKFFPNRILGFLAFSWSVTVFGFIIQSPDFFENHPHFYGSLDIFTLFFFPLTYLYIRYYLYKDIKTTWKQVIHFMPAILYTLLSMPFFLVGTEEKAALIKNGVPNWFVLVQTIFNVVIILQGVVYSILSLKTLHHFQYFRKSRLSDYQLQSLKWLRLFIVINIILWVTGTTGVFLEIFGIHLFIDLFQVYYAGLTLLVIVLSIFTIQRPELFSESEDISELVRAKVSTQKKKDEQKQTATVQVKDSEDYQLLLNHIEKERPYLKNDLKMQDLVDATGLTYKRISELFNNDFNKSFYDIMNEYRIKEALKLINDGFHIQHTLPHLGEEAGFNSKTTFNRIFKKHTGQTPTEYIQSMNKD